MTMKTNKLLTGASVLCFKGAGAAAEKRADVTRATTFVPIIKVDAETRTIYGRLADETPDLAGEIFDYETSAPYFTAWSEKAMKTTGGKSAGNLRVMHGLKVAGKLIELVTDDAEKTIDIAAQVVDDAEWAMVEAGCYTGFSLGGKYVGKKWKDKGDPTKTRYTVNPYEASLVDVPCIPTATFTLKADGAETQVEFKVWEPPAAALAAKAAELAGDGGEWTDKLDEAREVLRAEHTAEVLAADPAEQPAEEAPADTGAETVEGEAGEEAAQTETVEQPVEEQTEATADADAGKAFDPNEGLEQVWRAPDGTLHATKAAARDANAKAHAKASVSGNALAGALASLKAATTGETPAEDAAPETFVVEGAAEVFADFATVKALFDTHVAAKGIYDVRNLASLIQELQWLTDNSICEAGQERDGSPVPAQLMGNLRSLSNTLVTMAREETAEMIAMLQRRGVDVQVFEAAEAGKSIEVGEGDAAKAVDGAEVLPTITVSAELHAVVVEKAAALPDLADETEAEPEAVTKALAIVREENAALKAQIDEVVPAMTEAADAIKAMRAELDSLKAEPLPSAHSGRAAQVVSKGADSTPDGQTGAIDVTGQDPGDVIKGLVEKHGQAAVSAALIAQSHRTPMGMSPAG